MTEAKTSLRKKEKRFSIPVWGPLLWSLLFVVLGYVIENNVTYPLFEDWLPFSIKEYVWGNDADPRPFSKDSLLCVDVAYDKQFAQYAKDGIVQGDIVITDRAKLLEFFQIARNADYKYCFLDVRFEKGVRTDSDSLLFQTILDLPRLVIANHAGNADYQIADERLLGKAALADYHSTLFTGFTRYNYLQKAGPSVALKMYEDLDQGSIRRRGPFFFSGGRLCTNAQFLSIPAYLTQQERDDQTMLYPHLGAQLLDNPPELVASAMSGKIILIGDFNEDKHQTYMGDIPGCLLSYLAYLDLHQGKHNGIAQIVLALVIIVLYFLCFAGISLCLSLQNPSKKRSSLFIVVTSFITWGLFFLLVKTLVFKITGIAISTLIPVLVFPLVYAVKKNKFL